ncbi:MAG: hypothetical protein IJH60_04970 [Eubacterium sp.]|nr:hypothetical protein [Eubacterium sp.]
MSDLSNSKYAELMDLLEQQEEEIDYLKKQLEEHTDRNGAMSAELRILREQKAKAMNQEESLFGEIQMIREKNQKLNMRIEEYQKINIGLKDRIEKERWRSESICNLMRQGIREKESEVTELKGVLFLALFYSIIITVFQAIRDGALFTELRETGSASWTLISFLVKNLLIIGETAGLQSQMNTEGSFQVVSYYLTKISVLGFLGLIMIIPVIWMIRKLVLFYRNRMMNLPVLLVTAVSLSVMVWFGTGIQKLIPMSSLEMIAQVQIILALTKLYSTFGDEYNTFYNKTKKYH